MAHSESKHSINLRVLAFSAIMISYSCFATDTNSVYYCGVRLQAPDGCEISELKITCDLEFINWTFFDEVPVQAREEVARQSEVKTLDYLKEKVEGYKKRDMKFISCNQELKGWVVTGRFNGQEKYFLFAVGVVDTKTVRIYAGLMGKPKRNTPLPSFVSQIIQIDW